MSRQKITARLRSEDTERLPQLLRIYATDPEAVAQIQDEIIRRQRLAGGTANLPTTTR